MKPLLLILILGYASALFAQSKAGLQDVAGILDPMPTDAEIFKEIDSLKRLVVQANSQQRTDLYRSLFAKYMDVDQDSASSYANRLYNQASMNADSLNMVVGLNARATILKNGSDFTGAIKLFENALRMARRNGFLDQTKFLLNNLAMANSEMSFYEKALAYHFESLKLREESGTPADISITLNNIGVIYDAIEDDEKALLYYEKCYAVRMEHHLGYGLAGTITNIGWALIDLGQVARAESRLQEVFVMCDTFACSPGVLIKAYEAFGVILFKQNKLDESENYLKRSLEISVADRRVSLGSPNSSFVASTLYWLAEVSEKRNRPEEAISRLNRSHEIAQPGGFKKILLKDYLLYTKIYSDNRNYQKAFEFQTLYIHLNAEVINTNLLRKISYIQADYQERENTAKISTQEKIMAAQTESIRGQQLLNILIGVITILSFALVGLLFKINRKKQKVNEVLDQRVKDRTVELEKSQDALRQSKNERVMLLRRVSADLLSSWATLNGLSSLAAKDLTQEQAAYFKEAEATAERIVTYVNKYSMQE